MQMFIKPLARENLLNKITFFKSLIHIHDITESYTWELPVTSTEQLNMSYLCLVKGCKKATLTVFVKKWNWEVSKFYFQAVGQQILGIFSL